MSWSRGSSTATLSRAGPRFPPWLSSAWQLWHCFNWNTRAPCRSSADRLRKYCGGMGVELHASITGLQGVYPERCVKVPNETATNKIDSTAIGLRRQLFSPSPKINGRRKSARSATTGPTSSAGVSIEGGKSESTAYSHKKKKSGRGAV